MPSFDILEPAIDPGNRITFLLDWELTMKCNLDCSYCVTGLYGGHNNAIPHPDKDKCIRAIDFMFEYVDQYMKYKPQGIRYVVLNIYGGEALAHPNIVEILEQVKEKYQPYKDRWHLTVTTTTNAILSRKTLGKILPLIDEFTVSYHPENTDKQKEQFKNNLITIRDAGNRLKCVVLMHTDPVRFADSESMLDWLSENSIKRWPKQMDNAETLYSTQQIKWFNHLYKITSHNTTTSTFIKEQETLNITGEGRACCGGRKVCQDQNYKERLSYSIDNKFTGWYCSVNWFFMAVKQVTGEIFVNKDCKMNFQGSVGPIGMLDNPTELLEQLKQQLASKTLPVIQCNKPICFCGLCAPKSKTLDKYNVIIKKYQKDY